MSHMPRGQAIRVFLGFAFAYFLSTVIRAITATLSPTLTEELSLQASDLGLLAGAYFLGFSLTQIPLGNWLDRFGPKKVILSFLAIAVLGSISFAMAQTFAGLLVARVLTGIGVSACLMAPLTGYRRWFTSAAQLRSNSWMLMTGSFGMVAATLPVQWLLPIWGWRPLFWIIALLLLAAMVLLTWLVPSWANTPATPCADVSPMSHTSDGGYAHILRHPYFRKMAPMGVFIYGGLVAMQTLWATPWMIQVAGWTPLQAAQGMFWLNIAMLLTFWCWGLANPWLAQRALDADTLIRRLMPLSFVILAIIIIAGSAISTWSAAFWTLYCMSCTVVALSQPAVAMAFAPTLAGRALAAFNLLIFSGVFVVQWGIGLIVDALRALNWPLESAYQLAMLVYLICTLLSYFYFLLAKSHNPA